MKKLFLYIFLVLMFCNVGFADQLSFDKKCKETSYITEDGKKKYKIVCGKTLECDDGSTNTINLEHQVMGVTRGEDYWDLYVVGDYQSGIFSYYIYENSEENDEYYFFVLTSNLDNQINKIYGEGDHWDFIEILKILKNIDSKNVSAFDKYVSIPSERNRNYQIEKEKLNAIIEFISTLKNKDKINLKCWSYD